MCVLLEGRLEVFSRPGIMRSEVCEVGTYPVGKRVLDMELSLSNTSQYVGFGHANYLKLIQKKRKTPLFQTS